MPFSVWRAKLVGMSNNNPEVDTLIESIKKEAAHLGLHMQDVMIASSADMSDPQTAQQFQDKSIKEILDTNGEVSVAVMAYFLIGDLAFSERVQNPEAFDTDQQFKLIMPTEHELLKDKVAEKIQSVSPDDDEDAWLDALFGDEDDED